MDEHIKGKWLNLVRAPGDLIATGDDRGDYAVHAALLRTGRVIIWSGRVESAAYLYRSWTWDPATFSEGDPEPTGVIGRWFLSDFDPGGPKESPPGNPPRWSDDRTIDLFCAHQVNLEDGRLLAMGGAGGLNEGDARGNPAIYTYDPEGEAWTKAAHLLERGRWYPTPVTLPDGRVAVFSGRPQNSGGQEAVAEVIAPPHLASETIGGADKRMFIYPGLVLAPGGEIFFVPTTWMTEASSEGDAANIIGSTESLRMSGRTSGAWQTHPDPNDPASDLEPINRWREEGTFVLLPPAQAGRILVIGGGFAFNALQNTDQRAVARPGHCEILETQGASPRWVEAGEMHLSRVNVHAVLLPDGKVLIVGGHDSVKRNPDHVDRLAAEIFDPTVPFDPANPRAAFTEAAEMAVSRNYHATCLLLPDGRVFAAGGEDGAHYGGNQTTMQLYEPPYLHLGGAAPEIQRVLVPDAPDDEIAYGQPFVIECASAEQAASIDKVVLMRPGAPTHHTDSEQRYVPLNFSYTRGSVLTATAVYDPSVAPPGYYMLWIVDGEGRPCKRAPFVRLSHRRCQLITDRSTISIEEVQATGSRTVPDALYVHLDGFFPEELAITTPSPAPALLEAIAPAVTVSRLGAVEAGVRVRVTDLLLEDPALDPSVKQRVTFRYALRFDDLGVFPPEGGAERLTYVVTARKKGWSCDGRLHLMRQPDPYMLDGATHWLSTDVRVFKLRAGEARFGVTLDANDPHGFITQVMSNFDADPGLASHPFESLAEGQAESRLQIAESEGGVRVFNFAVCRVRYRAAMTHAQRVRLHFRMFTTTATNLNYDPSSTYPVRASGGSNIASPGVTANEIVTIPFYASPRVDLAAQGFGDQQDAPNEKDMPAQAGTETRRYFGAFLDFNQSGSRLPRNMAVTDAGPFAAGDLVPVAELIRGRHQCLVAEVDFPVDPIPVGDSPANNDNLSQRNLAIEGSDNPGGPDAHTVALTFDIDPDWHFGGVRLLDGLPDIDETRRPAMLAPRHGMMAETPAAAHGEEREEAHGEEEGHGDLRLAHMPEHHAPVPARHLWALGAVFAAGERFLAPDPIGVRFAAMPHEHRAPPRFDWFRPGELMIDWGELPSASQATLYLPGIRADDVLAAARLRQWWPRIRKVDDHTLQLPVDGLSHVPLPALVKQRQAALLTVTLPAGVRFGQRYRAVVRQISNMGRVVVGAFELDIEVSGRDALLGDESRWYAVAQHIFAQMRDVDRWKPVWERYLAVIRGRVAGFGGDPGRIPPALDPDADQPAEECPGPQDVFEGLGEPGEPGVAPDGDEGDDALPADKGPGGDQIRGKIVRLEFDCRGAFTGFVVEDCDGVAQGVAADCGVRDVALLACRERLTVTVTLRARRASGQGPGQGAVNKRCPWSGKAVSGEALVLYRGHLVGFCSRAHRDRFAQALAHFRKALEKRKAAGDTGQAVNTRCPWSGRPVEAGATMALGAVVVGFCSPRHRDEFQAAVEAFDRAIACQGGRKVVRAIDLHC